MSSTVCILVLLLAVIQTGISQSPYQCSRVNTIDGCFPNNTQMSFPARNSLYQYPQMLPEELDDSISPENVAFGFRTIQSAQGDPECAGALQYALCLAATPPCSSDSGLLLPICEDSCLAYTRVIEEGRCQSLVEFGNTLLSIPGVNPTGTASVILSLLFQFNCSILSTYYFYDNAESFLDQNECTDLYLPEQKEQILSRGNQCIPTTSSLCDDTNYSPYNTHVPLFSRNSSLLETIQDIANDTSDENCTAALTFLSCSYIFPPCNPDSGVALPICTDVCKDLTSVIESCVDSTVQNDLLTLLRAINCSNPKSYIPPFVHMDDTECVDSTSGQIEVTTSESEPGQIEVTTSESEPDPRTTIGIAVGVVLGIIAIVTLTIVVMVAVIRKRRSPKKVPIELWSRKEPMIHRDNSAKYSESQGSPLGTEPTAITEADRQNYKKIFSAILVPYPSLTIRDEIGHGAFGQVYHGQLRRPSDENSIEIAIKTIRNLSSKDAVSAFFAESLLMKDFEHPNILGLTGVCFDTPDGVPYILLPFMANGSLKDYLKKKRTHVTNVNTLPEDLEVATLVRICMDIANGMEYLATKKFVHRDLAARNCLVDENLTIKVADFGLAKDVYSSDYYRAGQGAKLPVKWMAPETLHDGISNEKTDVWSYGVTCWEVFSLGRAPYPGTENSDILEFIVTKHKRLDQPTLCTTKLYNVAIFQCWSLAPEERPTFSQLVLQLQEYWEEEHAYY